MKIIAFILLILIGFFTMEPLLSIRGIFGRADMADMATCTISPSPGPAATGMRCCGRMKPCPKSDSPPAKSSTPSKNRGTANAPCNKNTPAGNNEKCQGNGCNPFMACAYGNFYLAEKGGVDFISIVLQKDKKILINDNRLSSRLSECWHPPKPASVPTS